MTEDNANLPPEEGVSPERVEKRTDKAERQQATKKRVWDFIGGFMTHQDYLTGKRYYDPGRVGLVLGGIGISGIVLASGWLLSLRKVETPTVAAMANAPAPVQPKPVMAGALPEGREATQRVIPPKPIVAGAPPSTLNNSVRSGGNQQRLTASLSSKMTPEQQLQKNRTDALNRVQMRSANKDPLPGSRTANTNSYPIAPPPPRMDGMLQPLPPYPGAVGRGNQTSYNPQLPVYLQSESPRQLPAPNFLQAQAQAAPSYPSPCSSGNCGAGVNVMQTQTQTGWNLVPPGNMVRVVTRSTLQVLRKATDAPVFAQVQGAIRVDDQEVIPDGAVLMGRVINVDENLGRVRIEFTSLSFGTTTLTLRGATAWTLTGETVENSALSEGLVAEATETPNYLVSDATAGLGQAAERVAQSLGQQSSISVGSLGTPFSLSTQSGDLTTSLQRGLAQGLGTVFNRQTERADQGTSRQETRGPIYFIAAGREFIVFLSQGV